MLKRPTLRVGGKLAASPRLTAETDSEELCDRQKRSVFLKGKPLASRLRTAFPQLNIPPDGGGTNDKADGKEVAAGDSNPARFIAALPQICTAAAVNWFLVSGSWVLVPGFWSRVAFSQPETRSHSLCNIVPRRC